MTKTTRTTRACLLGLMLSSPLFAAARCDDGRLVIGGDAGSGALDGSDSDSEDASAAAGRASFGGGHNGGGTTYGGHDAGGSNGATACEAAARKVEDFLVQNKACETNDDCQRAFVGCGITEDDCTGAVYFNKDASESDLATLRDDFLQCVGQPAGCPVCTRIATPPACVDGHCGPAPS